MQAKDLADEMMVRLCWENAVARYGPDGGIGACRGDICALLPNVPEKVVLAKLCKLVKKGLLTGCDEVHWCRGDHELTGAGHALIALTAPTAQ
jgi:hypothetical protein